MKKFLEKILLFIPLSITTYIFLIIIWGDFAPGRLQKNLNYRLGSSGHLYSRLNEIKDTQDVDVLVLGSSHAYRGFDTRIFKKAGLKTFNLGSSSQTPMQTEVLLKRYLDELSPKIILYEVYPATFSSDGVESSLDIIANDKNDSESIDMAFRQNHIKVYNLLIYGFYRDLFKKNSYFIEASMKGDDKYIEGGYVERKLQYFKYLEYDRQKWELNNQQFKAFEQVLNLFDERNIPFVLVQAPITTQRYQSYVNNTEFDSTIKKYGKYFNFNKILDLDDRLHFYDSHHLNQDGVEIFNKKLIEIIFKDD